MDSTLILCILLVLCVLLAYLAGRADAKGRMQKEIGALKEKLSQSEESQRTMTEYVNTVKTTLVDIRTALVGVNYSSKKED